MITQRKTLQYSNGWITSLNNQPFSGWGLYFFRSQTKRF